jgi:hypothetical protein
LWVDEKALIVGPFSFVFMFLRLVPLCLTVESLCSTHFLGTLFSVVMHSVDEVLECDWYILIMTIDTVLGCVLSISLFKITVTIASDG